MSITKVKLPSSSELGGTAFDYVDSYQGCYPDPEHIIDTKTIGKAFFSSAPKWTASLFELRNRIVSVFGLKTPAKTTNRQKLLDQFNCEPNERLGLFKVYSRTENEIILGEDDKHLNFRISLLRCASNDKKKKTLIISTTVKFNNWFGKLYFLPVKPFHRLIVPQMLKGTIRHLENSLEKSSNNST